ncbi:MAG: hypothetical protein H7263_10085 [Candidatus Sericytochromatia bacterium]|nr:hypothetical protein [Candidatus Sericytochromatia bacterium]
MGWLKKLFGFEEDEAPVAEPTAEAVAHQESGEAIPAERVGLHGEYDQSGLAKRVAVAFDGDSSLADIDSIYVAQTGTTVVLKGNAPDQETVDKMVQLAEKVSGAQDVDASNVEIG